MTIEPNDPVMALAVKSWPWKTPLAKLANMMGGLMPLSQPRPLGPAVAPKPPVRRPLPTLFPQRPPTTGMKAMALPGTPGHAATNVIDQLGALDASGRTVDGNNAAGIRKGANDDEDQQFVPRGWQWKSLQKSQGEAAEQWLPRLFTSPATPITEMLASPGRQGILGALLGGAAGAGAAGLGGYAMGSPHTPGMAVGGGALGALLGGFRGYSSRVRKNDEILDALRRSPPGATLRDFEELQKRDRMSKVSFPRPLSRYLETALG